MKTNAKKEVQLLKQATVATRLRWHWLGKRAKAEDAIKEKMVETLTTWDSERPDEESYSVSKVLYNTRLESLKAIQKFKGEVQSWWEERTLPYVEPGVRLLKKEDLEGFNLAMESHKEKLEVLATNVQLDREEIIEDAKKRLKGGFQEANYPPDLRNLFGVEWSFPSIEPPEYLAKMSPQVYEQEKQRAEARLKEAIDLAQAAFLQEFKGVVDTLHERLSPDAGGGKKVIKNSAVENLAAFIDKFQKLNVTGMAEIEELVTEAKELISWTDPETLRKAANVQQEVLKGISGIKEKLDPLVVAKPRRNILRPNQANNQKAEQKEVVAV